MKTWRYVDTGPLSDRSYAAQAGLGWIGKNGMLIHEQDGSYFFIGTLLTALENDIDVASSSADRCGTCTRCLDACPTNAILPDRTLDSAALHQLRDHRTSRPARPAHRATPRPATPSAATSARKSAPGTAAPPEAHPAFAARDEYRATPITDLLRFTQTDFSSLFRKSAIKRAKLAGMQRNVEALTGEGDRGILEA